MLILTVIFRDGHSEEYRYCTMEGLLNGLKSIKAEGKAKYYKIEEID